MNFTARELSTIRHALRIAAERFRDDVKTFEKCAESGAMSIESAQVFAREFGDYAKNCEQLLEKVGEW